MKKNIIIIICMGLILVMSLFAGCGEKNNKPSSNEKSENTSVESENNQNDNQQSSSSDSGFKPVTDGGNYETENDY